MADPGAESRSPPGPAGDAGPEQGVAIVGMSCMFAGASRLDAYWGNIVDQVVAVGDVPPGRWERDGSVDGRPARGGFLGNAFGFDPVALRVPPSAMAGADPDQFLVLRCAQEALADASCSDEVAERASTEVIIGRAAANGPGSIALWQRVAGVPRILEILAAVNPRLGAEDLARIEAELLDGLPPFRAETVPGVVPNVVAGRVANRFDLMAGNFVVDAACATGLVVTELAVRSLMAGSADLSIVGAVHADINPALLWTFDSIGALSADGVCRPFDAAGTGTVLGEGVGVLVLKRVADARRDGDRVYAVLKGLGSSSDGKSTALLAPSREGELLALERAYARAGVPKDTVELVEAHGTGTAAGDRTELEVLDRFFGRERPNVVAVGSVKSMIGHTLAAAGMASLIKTALALHQRVLPATANCGRPHALAADAGSALYVNTDTRPWLRAPQGGPRRAGVSAFGFGGVNAHAVLEEFDGGNEADRPSLRRRWPCELAVFAADSAGALADAVEGAAAALAAAPPDVELARIACALNSTRQPCGDGPRLAVVARDAADLLDRLRRAVAQIRKPGVTSIACRSGTYYESAPLGGKLAFVFPGEGSPRVNALRDLAVALPPVRAGLERADRHAVEAGTEPVARYLYPPPGVGGAEAAEATLRHVHRSAPLARAVDLAMHALAGVLGIRADMVCGHSAGEWAAMVAAGILDGPGLARLHAELGAGLEVALAGMPPAVLLAVGAGGPEVARLGADSGCPLELVNDNCPHQAVVALAPVHEAAFAGHCRAKRIVVERLPFDRPFHTHHYDAFVGPVRRGLARLDLAPPQMPLYSCHTASPLPSEAGELVDLAAVAAARPVRFRETVARMYEDGARVFLELGAGSVLTGFVADILGAKARAVAFDRAGSDGIEGLLHGLARLATAGVPLDLDPLYAVRGIAVRDIAGALAPERAGASEVEVSLVAPGLSTPKPVHADAHARRPGPVPDADVGRAMGSYFDTMEAFIAAEERILTASLGLHDGAEDDYA